MKWIGAWRGDFPLRALLRGKGRGRVASGTVRRRVEGPHGPIEYTLTAKKVKNFNLRIGPDGGVKVSVPRSVSAAQADRFVLSRAAWIEGARRRMEARPLRARFEDGGLLYLRGEPLAVAVSMDAQPAVWREGEVLHVRMREEGELRPLLRSFLEKEAAADFGPRLQRLYPTAAAEGVALPVLRLRWMTGRWGSCACGKGEITLNKALIAAPPDCIDYVIYHELAHFLEPNHSPAFYRVLDGFFPGHRALQARMRQMHPADWTP